MGLSRLPRAQASAWRRFLCAACLFALLCNFLSGLAELLLPVASGDVVYDKKGTTVDASHADQGYIMVKQKATNKRLKLRISLGDEQLTYDLNSDGEFEVFPLQLGDGKYKVQLYSQVSGSRYTALSSVSVKAALENPLLPFLYPSQYVNFDENSEAVKKANEICQGLATDEEKFHTVYKYVTSHIVYDYILALTVKSGYLPSVDATLGSGKGICFDIASLVAAMLRSQGVPTQLVIGYADKNYHSWNLVYYNDTWMRCDATADISSVTVDEYTTERFY